MSTGSSVCFTSAGCTIIFSMTFAQKNGFSGAQEFICSACSLACFYQDPFHKALVAPLILGSLIISFCVFLHLHQLKKYRPLPPQQYNLMFWIDRGLLLFHIPFPFIHFCAIMYYREVYEPLFLATVLNCLIAGMYILFTIGFIRSSRPAFR